MAANEDRDARLEQAWSSLSSHPGTKVTTAALAKAAACSLTYAAPFRRMKLGVTKRGRKQTSIPASSAPTAPVLEGRDGFQTALLKLASVAQGQVGQLIQILDGAVSQRNGMSLQPLTADAAGGAEAALAETRMNEADGASPQNPVPFVDTVEAPLATAVHALSTPQTPRKGRGKRSGDPSQLMLGFEWPPNGPATTPSADQAALHSTGENVSSISLEAVDLASMASDLLQTESDTSDENARSTAASSAHILCDAGGPLGAFAIGEELRKRGELKFPMKRLKEVLLSACPTHFDYEAASGKFWANVPQTIQTENDQPMSIRIAAVKEAVKQLNERKRPVGIKDLYSSLPEQIRYHITLGYFDVALKTADLELGDLRQNDNGRWFLAQHGDRDPFKRRPTKMYAPLRRELIKILTKSTYKLHPRKIFRELPEWIARHFTEANIEEHIEKVSRGLARDVDGTLSLWLKTPPNGRAKRRVWLGKLARTSAIVDAAIDRLEKQRRTLHLDDLYEPNCGIERDAFRKAMNQRQKSSTELERIDEGRYRYNPVLV
ncbi:hypothetical protein QY049_28855 [Bradyrhizobium sp. WYCCWR 13022]|uniref:hypothetical protein n=1 Tax=unclassified Bradyrhizobium TaxID=2631580 RepID=UPI00263A8192|nr:hypothetical protein [Bradyrhizobium sp. WYCCWR 13022]MDN4987176.1 hypothetical protein [Bradyrhizobium sp. WYCCWR 13022]